MTDLPLISQAFWSAVSALLEVQPFAREARNQGLEEAAKFVEENYEEPFVNIVGNPSWRERGPKSLAAAIRALKDKP